MEWRAGRCQYERDVHCRQILLQLVMFNRSSAHDVHSGSSCELFDAPALRAVTDEKQGNVVGAGQRGDCLIERMKAAEAPDPADNEAVLEPESYSRCRTTRVRREQVGVHPRRRDDDPPLVDAQPDDFGRYRFGSAGDHVGSAQRDALAEVLECPAPSRTANPPLPCLPDERRRDENDRWHM
jgi:hypothetical protein